jgi:hypothetical protein
MELMTSILVTVSAGYLLELGHDFDPVCFCVTADFTQLLGYG